MSLNLIIDALCVLYDPVLVGHTPMADITHQKTEYVTGTTICLPQHPSI